MLITNITFQNEKSPIKLSKAKTHSTSNIQHPTFNIGFHSITVKLIKSNYISAFCFDINDFWLLIITLSAFLLLQTNFKLLFLFQCSSCLSCSSCFFSLRNVFFFSMKCFFSLWNYFFFRWNYFFLSCNWTIIQIYYLELIWSRS